MPPWQQRAARLGHCALYDCILAMPVSGYIASNIGKHGVKFFGLALRPWCPDLPAVYAAFNLLHVTSGWLFAALIASHVPMALKHRWIDRDGMFSRISPWPASR